jgi:hypothetical protein
MVQPDEVVGGEWAERYRLTPIQRWLESEKLRQAYLALGGSLDPEPDTQSPFFDVREPGPRPALRETCAPITCTQTHLPPRREGRGDMDQIRFSHRLV